MRALTRRFARHLRGRGRALAVPVLLASAVHTLVPRPPERIAREPRRLGLALNASSGEVAPSAELAWEPRGSARSASSCSGAGSGSSVAPAPGRPRDLFRASVRLWPNGQPLTLSRPANLSQDVPDADESGLIVAGTFGVLYATPSRKRAAWAAVTVLDAESSRRARSRFVGLFAARAATGLWSRCSGARICSSIRTGELGVDQARRISRSFASSSAPARATSAYDLEQGTITGDDHGAVRALRRVSSSERDVREETGALVNTGPRCSATDRSRRLRRPGLAAHRRASLHGTHARTAGHAHAEAESSGLATLVESPLLKLPLGVDPPAGGRRTRAVSFCGRRLSAVSIGGSGLHRARGDPAASSSSSACGQGARGRRRSVRRCRATDGCPRIPSILRRVVAVFNAGPEAAYDRYGADDGRMRLLVAARGAASECHRDALAPGHARSVAVWRTRFPRTCSAASRQRRTALVNGGNRGGESRTTSVRRRSALCATVSTATVSSTRVRQGVRSGDALGQRALVSAGCEVALPLAASPERLGLVLVDAKSRADARLSLLDADMDFGRPRGHSRARRADFFYLSVRDVRPKLPPGVAMEWQADGGAEPPPAWLPGILRGELTLGGVTLTLASFETARSDFRVRPGPLEPGAKGQPWSGLLSADDQARALASSSSSGTRSGATRLGARARAR